MHADTAQNASRSPFAKSAMANGRRATLFGDGRSLASRRRRDVLAAFFAEAGDPAKLSASDKEIIQRLTTATVEIELLEAERVSGGKVDPVALATMINLQRRLLADLAALKQRLAASRVPATKAAHKPASSRKRTTALDALATFGA